MQDQPYGDARAEFDHYDHRPSAPVPPWNERAYDTTDEKRPTRS